MSRLTRRSFVAGAAAAPLLAWLDGLKAADYENPRVRHDARSPKGREMLKLYAEAVGKMQKTAETDPGDPVGWLFQWYTHWVKGSTTKANEITRVYGNNPSPNRDLAEAAWDTCQAHGGGNEDFFLPWHRIFVYYFEEIVRNASGDPSFTLPYWNYSTPDQKIRGVIPPEFTKKGDPLYKSLYVENRNPGVNAGEPIQQGQPGDPLSTSALAECVYGQQGADQGFCMALDFGLHGNVHVLVGDGQNMGSVPWAANDPIFWLHHCNIDRLWASWNAAGRANPTLQQNFTFADKNGKKVARNLNDFLSLAKLGYKYDQLETVPPCPMTTEAIAAAAKAQARVAAVKATPVKLGAEAVTVPLEAQPEPGGKPGQPLRRRVQALPAGRRLILVLKDPSAQAQPGVLYHVYLDLPANATDAQKKAHYVGALNFFGVVPHGEHQHEKPGEKGSGRFVSFDITTLAKALHANKALTEKPTVTIAPVGKPAAEAKPVVGEISVVEQ